MCGELTIQILLFSTAREAAGTHQVQLKFKSDEDSMASSLRKKLATLYPKLAQIILDEEMVALAVNEEYLDAGTDVMLKHGDTVAIIPPISGG